MSRPRARAGGTAPGTPAAPPRRPRWFLDANVVLDVLARREPWAHEAALVLSAIEAGRATGAIAAHTATTLYYLLAKELGWEAAVAALVRLMALVDVVAVDRGVILEAIALGFSDLEDGVQTVCALRMEADYLVTRNGKDFQRAGLPIGTPGEVLAQL